MPLLYTPDLLFEGFSLSRAVLLDSEGNEQPDGEIYGARSAVWEPEIESYDEFSHEKLINVWSDVRRVNFTVEAGYTSMIIWSKLLGSSVTSQPLITNLLTANQASVETDTSGWTVDGGVTLSKQSSPTYHGSSSLLATCTGTGAGQFSAAGARIPVTAGDTVTFMAQAHAGVGSRQVQALLLFYDAASGGTLIGGDSVKGPLVTTAGSWRQASLTTVVPSATHAVPSVGLAAGGATDAVYFDAFSFHRGTGGTWAMPGEPILGLTDSPANWQDSLPLWEHGSGNAQALPVRITFPAKDAAGNMQDLSLTLFKVKFKPPKSSGAAYKDGQSVSYEATAMLSATDETGAVLEREAFGRIDRAYSVG